MAIKQTGVTRPGHGGFEFSGNIVSWITDFERWYKEETINRKADIPFDDYVGMLTILYSHYAKLSLTKQGGYQSLLDRIDTFYPRHIYAVRPGEPGFNMGNLPVGPQLLHALDFLADTFPADLRTNYERVIRDYARNFLWFKR